MVFHEEFYPHQVDVYSPFVLEGGTIVLIKEHSDYLPLEEPYYTNLTHTSQHLDHCVSPCRSRCVSPCNLDPCVSPCRSRCLSPCKTVCPPRRPSCQIPYCPSYRPQCASPCTYQYPCRSSCVPIYRPQYQVPCYPAYQNPCQQSCYPPYRYRPSQICVQPRCHYPLYPLCPSYGYPRRSQCEQPCPYEYQEYYLF